MCGGDDDVASCDSGVNRAPGVVIYRGCVMGSAGDTDEDMSSSDTGPTDGLALGCAMSFHTLGLNVWPTCDRMLLITGGRFEDPGDVVTELITEEEDDAVTVGITSITPLPDPPVTPMATEEYEGEPLTTLDVLLVEFFLGIGSDGVSGNNCRLAGVGGFTTPELDELLIFEFPPDGFLTGAEVTGATLVREPVVAT